MLHPSLHHALASDSQNVSYMKSNADLRAPSLEFSHSDNNSRNCHLKMLYKIAIYSFIFRKLTVIVYNLGESLTSLGLSH